MGFWEKCIGRQGGSSNEEGETTVAPPILAAVAAALRRQDSPESEEAMGRSLRGREEDERFESEGGVEADVLRKKMEEGCVWFSE